MDMKLFDGIKVVLWDIDGTVLDFFEAQKNAIRTLFEKFRLGECTDEMLYDYDSINHKYWQALERGEITKPQVLTGRFREFFEKYRLDTTLAEEFNDAYQLSLGDTICFYPGVEDVIRELKDKKIPQFAVTNGTKTAQRKKLSRSGLDRIFDSIFISEDVGYEKPNPKFFEPVMKKAVEFCGDVKPEEMLIIGDSVTSDMQLGKNVGVKTCWFRHPDEPDCELAVDYEIRSFEG